MVYMHHLHDMDCDLPSFLSSKILSLHSDIGRESNKLNEWKALFLILLGWIFGKTMGFSSHFFGRKYTFFCVHDHALCSSWIHCFDLYNNLSVYFNGFSDLPVIPFFFLLSYIITCVSHFYCHYSPPARK